MKTIGIICEFNPLHKGHVHLLSSVRRQFPDSLLLCVMSGALLQRGSFALFDKYTRAAAAVRMGANLVVELPFPWSMGSAEFFAAGGVSLLDAFSADGIAFGAETDNTALLCSAAEHFTSDTFRTRFSERLKDADAHTVGYPKLQETVFRSLFGDAEADLLALPNNSLALAYLAAAKRQHTALTPFSVPRIGDAHHAEQITESGIASATAVRNLFYEGQTEAAFSALPKETLPLFRAAYENGKVVLSEKNADTAVLWYYRTTPPEKLARYAGMGGGLAARFCEASRQTTDIPSLLAAVTTKTTTHAACRRSLWNGFFGVTEAMLRAAPPYTVLLAADAHGIAWLSHNAASVPVITKPASVRAMSEAVRTAHARSHSAEAFRAMLNVCPGTESALYRVKPYIMT